MKRVQLLLAFMMFCGVMMANEIKRPDSYNFQRGCEAVNKGDYDEGMFYLQKELSENPKNGYAWAWILAINVEKEEFGEAIQSAEIALKLLPKKDKEINGYVHKTLSGVYYQMEDTLKAIQEIDEAIRLVPKENDYLFARADIYYDMKDYERANLDFERVLKNDAGNVAAHTGIGRNLLAQKKYDEAIAKFTYAMKLDPKFSQLYAFRADCYTGKADHRAAAQDLVKALELDANNRAFYTIQTCNDTCYQNLVILMKVKAAKDNQSTDWNYTLGSLHQQHNHYYEAIQEYKISLDREPSAMAYENIADCYGEVGNYVLAHQYIDMALALDSTDVDCLSSKADFYYYQGNVDAAINQMDDLIEKNPEYYFGYYRRGFFKDNIHDVEGAISDYTYCITLKPEFVYAYLGRGDMYMLQGKETEAKADYLQVVKNDSVIREQGNSRQYAYLMLGMRDSAENYMNRILEKYPNEGNYYDAACLMSRMGENDRAIGYLQTAFEKGYHEIAHMEKDDDMDGIREMNEFKELVAKYKKIQTEKNQAETKNNVGNAVEMEVSEIPFKKDGDMMSIQCSINNLPLHFIFDTGASDVSISQVEASFMMKNGYLSKEDIVGKAYFGTADGGVHEGTILNLKHVTFGGLELKNVKASVVKSQKAPLLLGQSVFERLGKIEIDNTDKVVKVTHQKSSKQ